MEEEIDGIVLGGDEAESESNVQKNETVNETESNVENEAEIKTAENAENTKERRASIEEFYGAMVAGFAASRGSDYRLYLLQGNVSASVVYGIVGLGMFATPTEEESERIAKWCGEWQKESEKFIRVDVSKSEITAECAAVLKSLFTNRYMNEELNESLKNISFGQLDLIIRSKCSDRIVELDEMLEIMENAARLGFLESTDRKTFIEKIKGEIFTLGAKIDTVQSAFVRYFNDRKNIDPVNAVNSEKNRLILAKKCMEFSVVFAKIYGEEANNDEKFYIENLPSFLEACSLKLDSPVESFRENYFAQFKNSHDMSVPLSLSDFSELQASATITYGLSQDEWKTFVSENAISHEMVATQSAIDEMNERIRAMEEAQKNYRQAEIDALNAKIAELEKKQASASGSNSASSGRQFFEDISKSGMNALKNGAQSLEKTARDVAEKTKSAAGVGKQFFEEVSKSGMSAIKNGAQTLEKKARDVAERTKAAASTKNFFARSNDENHSDFEEKTQDEVQYEVVQDGIPQEENLNQNLNTIEENPQDEVQEELPNYEYQNDETGETQNGGKQKYEKQEDEISEKNKLAVILLCVFVGQFGIHHFYSGNVSKGIAVVILTIASWLTMGIGVGLALWFCWLVWWIVDIVNIARGKYKDGNGRFIKK